MAIRSPQRISKVSACVERTAKGIARRLPSFYRRFSSLSVRNISCLILVTAFGLRVALILAFHNLRANDNQELLNIAVSLATTRVFGNPYAIQTGPTAHSAPVYPFIIGLILWVFGNGARGNLIHLMFNSFLSSFQYSLLPRVAVAYGLNKRVGVLSGFFGALIPLDLLDGIRGAEAPLAGTTLIVLSLLVLHTWERQDFSTRSALVQGVCWGMGLLVAPTLIMVFLATSILSFLLFTFKRGEIIQYLAGLVCMIVLVLLPWTIRNYLQLGSFFFIRDDFGLEFSISNNGYALPNFEDNVRSGVYHSLHPITSYREASRVRELGEIDYNREKMSTALNWIGQNPIAFVRLTALRFLFFWFPKTLRPIESIALWLITISGLLGLFWLFRINRLAAVIISAIWLSFPLTFYVLQSSARYRYPIYWTFILLGSLAVDSLIRNFQVISSFGSKGKPT